MVCEKPLWANLPFFYKYQDPTKRFFRHTCASFALEVRHRANYSETPRFQGIKSSWQALAGAIIL
jgi:hypothetical protein